MSQVADPLQSEKSPFWRFDARRRWWEINYSILRRAVVTPAKYWMRIDPHVEGELPDFRPLMLVPVHRTSIDIYAVSYFIDEFVSYVSTDRYGHNRLANCVQRQLTSALGSIVWHEDGIENRRARAVALSRDVERRLDNRKIVAAFTQGEYQPHSVDSVEDGIVGLVRRYERRQKIKTGEQIRIPIVPVGIEYDLHGDGLVTSNFGRRLADRVPFFPRWNVPAFGSKVTVRFGNAHYFDEGETEDLTREVMREAAELSRIPYNID